MGGIFIVVLLQIAFVFSLVAAGLSIMDNASTIEADVGNDGWNDDEVDQRTYKEKLISTYHDQKYKLSLHHMTGGLLGKMSSHPDYGKRTGPGKIEKPSTGLKKLPPHLESRIQAKKRRKLGGSNRSSRSPSPQENTSQGRSSLMKSYRKNKLKKTSRRKGKKKKEDSVSVGEHTSTQASETGGKRKKRRKKVKKFSVTAEEI